MIDKEAIAAIAASQAISAAAAAVEQATGHAVALPENFKLHDLEQMAPVRRRARGLMVTARLNDFVDYTEAHAEDGASVFVDGESMTAEAVLNLGTPAAPGHADNQARLAPPRTAAYEALLTVATGTALKQQACAEFFEDWASWAQLQCFDDDGTEIQVGAAIDAVRSITIEGAKRVESIERSLGAQRSAFESVQASSGPRAFPTRVWFRCIPYVGLNERAFALRVGVLTSSDKPMLCLRIVSLEQHRQEMADELAALIREEFDEVPCIVGRYTPGK